MEGLNDPVESTSSGTVTTPPAAAWPPERIGLLVVGLVLAGLTIIVGLIAGGVIGKDNDTPVPQNLDLESIAADTATIGTLQTTGLTTTSMVATGAIQGGTLSSGSVSAGSVDADTLMVTGLTTVNNLSAAGISVTGTTSVNTFTTSGLVTIGEVEYPVTVGAPDQVLTMNGGQPAWATPAITPGVIVQPVMYVDSGSGNDANSGLTPGLAKATMQGVFDALENDIVWVGDATVTIVGTTYVDTGSAWNLNVPGKVVRITGNMVAATTTPTLTIATAGTGRFSDINTYTTTGPVGADVAFAAGPSDPDFLLPVTVSSTDRLTMEVAGKYSAPLVASDVLDCYVPAQTLRFTTDLVISIDAGSTLIMDSLTLDGTGNRTLTMDGALGQIDMRLCVTLAASGNTLQLRAETAQLSMTQCLCRSDTYDDFNATVKSFGGRFDSVHLGMEGYLLVISSVKQFTATGDAHLAWTVCTMPDTPSENRIVLSRANGEITVTNLYIKTTTAIAFLVSESTRCTAAYVDLGTSETSPSTAYCFFIANYANATIYSANVASTSTTNGLFSVGENSILNLNSMQYGLTATSPPSLGFVSAFGSAVVFARDLTTTTCFVGDAIISGLTWGSPVSVLSANTSLNARLSINTW